MRSTSLPWSLLALCSAVLADPFPYNPTRVLRAPNSTYAYLLQPSSQSSNQGVLRVLDLSKQFSQNSFPITTLSGSLPFEQDGTLVPYTAVIDAAGNITVFAGNCAGGASDTTLWQFSPDSKSSVGNGTWNQLSITDHNLQAGSNLTGTNYLAGGAAFAGTVVQGDPETSYYLFGGMCPFENGTTSANWVNESAYSNNMLQFDSTNSGSATFDINAIASQGPPVAEAGFTMTGLSPTFSVNQSGAAQSQQQDFLLLGGHTQQAFINMSSVAMFSLPQETWAFMPVTQPSTEVDPRSGHTAVLSEDGKSVIIFGGWVGDVTNPAQPQLAVLRLGSEFGVSQSEAWTWTVPSATGSYGPSGSGIYGHGATMLPGGVMMIAGGYAISSSSSKSRRQSTTNDVYLYNTTSNAWVSSYSPTPSTSASAENQSAGPLSKTSERAGLGVGLGLGVAALVVIICFYFWYTKKLRTRRENRERELLARSSDASFVDPTYAGHNGFDEDIGNPFASHPGSPKSPMEQAGVGTIFLPTPSPSTDLRRGLSNRSHTYSQVPRYEDRRTILMNAGIHPILESADEDRSVRGDDDQVRESKAAQQLREIERVLTPESPAADRNIRNLQTQLKARTSIPIKNPFADPEPQVPSPTGNHANPLGSNPVLPLTDITRKPVPAPGGPYGPYRPYNIPSRPVSEETSGSSNWQTVDDGATDPSSSSNGRASPSKTDRTSSTLSEQSHPSHASSNSITRTMSTRTGAILSAALAARRMGEGDGPVSPVDGRTSTMGTTLSSSSGRKSPYYFDQHNRISPSDARSPGSGRYYAEKSMIAEKSVDSFATAKTTFAQLQDEGKSLLGGRPMADRDDPYQRAMAATTPQMARQDSQRNPYSGAASPRRARGWIGSLRRALTAVSNSDRTFSLTSTQNYEDANEPRTSSSSPTRASARLHPTPSTSGPRRTVSDGSVLLQGKRGQQDWQDEKSFVPYRDDPDPGDWGEPAAERDELAAENEWDVEGAVTKRDVQVMFTVPKVRLRVVNADVDRASMRSASDGAVSRNGSLKEGGSLRGKNSFKTLGRNESLQSRSEDGGILIRVDEEGVSSGREI